MLIEGGTGTAELSGSVGSDERCVVAGYVSDHYSRRLLLLAGLTLLVGVSLGYAFLPYLAAVVLLRLIHGVLNGCVSTSLTTVACDTVPRSRFAEGMGFFGMRTEGQVEAVVTSGLAFGAFLTFLPGIILPIVSLILTFLGLNEASKDEPTQLRTAFISCIAALAFSIIAGIIQSVNGASNLF